MSRPETNNDDLYGDVPQITELKLNRDFQIIKDPVEDKYDVQFINPMFTGKNGLVVAYAPWCPHCEEMQDDLIEIARVTRGLYPIGTINVTDTNRGNNILADYLNIEGYPTIKYYDQGEFKDYTANGRNAVDFLRFLCLENGLCETI